MFLNCPWNKKYACVKSAHEKQNLYLKILGKIECPKQLLGKRAIFKILALKINNCPWSDLSWKKLKERGEIATKMFYMGTFGFYGEKQKYWYSIVASNHLESTKQ